MYSEHVSLIHKIVDTIESSLNMSLPEPKPEARTAVLDCYWKQHIDTNLKGTLLKHQHSSFFCMFFKNAIEIDFQYIKTLPI